jgi:phospholipid/cholesterol/gamma-HCH transport system permease protein
VLRPDASGIQNWDTSLILFLRDAASWCERNKIAFDETALPDNIAKLLAVMSAAKVRPVDKEHRLNILAAAGIATVSAITQSKQFTRFVGECTLSAAHLARYPRKFRWRDCLQEMQRCGAMALPIVGLISFLVGIILAYIGAVVLREYGGDIFIADLVSLAMVREMGAMMTGIVIAGRTGGAFAAQIANMKAGEEIDALVTFGIRPVDFLVIPRIVALALMMPLLSLYSNAIGNLGGMTVGALLLKIPPPAYWIRMQSILDMSDISTGLIKATTYGIIIGLAGCLRGLQAQRDSAGVGNAATSAVVTAMLYIIVACAIYAVIFNILGW